MNPVVGGALVTGFANLFGGHQSNQANLDAIREYNQAQMELAKYQNEYNLDMWNKQNEYNLPINQMNRIKAAGLNPNLVYGTGNVVGNTTSNAPQAVTPNLKPVTGKKNVIGPAVQASFDAFLRGAQIDQQLQQSAAQTDLLREQAATERTKQRLNLSQHDRNIIDNYFADRTLDLRYHKLDEEVVNLDWQNAEWSNWSEHRRNSENTYFELRNKFLNSQIKNLAAQTGLTYAKTNEVFALIDKIGHDIKRIDKLNLLTDEDILYRQVQIAGKEIENLISRETKDADILDAWGSLIKETFGMFVDLYSARTNRINALRKSGKR